MLLRWWRYQIYIGSFLLAKCEGRAQGEFTITITPVWPVILGVQNPLKVGEMFEFPR